MKTNFFYDVTYESFTISAGTQIKRVIRESVLFSCEYILILVIITKMYSKL